MAVTAAMIKELRERTGAGMMDCKKILNETNGDIELAIEELRKRGAAAAEKKAGRVAAEGVIFNASNENGAVLVEINSETDFSAKHPSFLEFGEAVANTVLAENPADVAALAALPCGDAESVEAARQALITKIGENIGVRRFIYMAGNSDTVATYLHGARIGVMVSMENGNNALGRDLAMHIAASRPMCISEDEMDQAVVAKEREILIAQAQDSGKPDDIIEKMIGGRMKKFLKENTLLGQPFVKNPDQTVEQLLKADNTSVTAMVRLEVGEGIEKKADDFVAEVMAQAGQ